MTPEEAHAEYQRHPNRLGSRLRKFLLLTGGILSALAGSIAFILFWIFTN